jgi:hypothetical protein
MQSKEKNPQSSASVLFLGHCVPELVPAGGLVFRFLSQRENGTFTLRRKKKCGQLSRNQRFGDFSLI